MSGHQVDPSVADSERTVVTPSQAKDQSALRVSSGLTSSTLSHPQASSAPVSPTTPTNPSQKVDGSSLLVKAPKKIQRVLTEKSLNTKYVGEVVPPQTPFRTLVLCFDGTGDQFDADNSNIVQFFSMLKKGDINQQMVYYQAGIGTYTIPQIATPFYSKLSKTIDMMIAHDLNHHVMSGYEFLMQNYKEGDKICIFGFSRGAYTARALAGMVHKVGLLPANNFQQVPFAYRMYMRDDEVGWQQSVLFKRTFSIDVDIEFVGVWDTVASVGIIPKRLPFTKSNTAIKIFRHALSLDEHRAKFKANTYNRTTKEEAERGDFIVPEDVKEEIKLLNQVPISSDVSSTDKAKAPDSATPPASAHLDTQHSGHNSHTILGEIKDAAWHSANAVRRAGKEVSKSHHPEEEIDPDLKERKTRLESFYTDRSKPTDVLEVWFAGCHCDVGGGSVSNSTRNSLARIPLRWMIRECFKMNTGIQFEAERLKEVGLDPARLWPVVLPRPDPLPVPKSLGPSAPDSSSADKGQFKRSNSMDKTLARSDAAEAVENRGVVDLGDTDKSDKDDGDGTDEKARTFVSEEIEELNDALSPLYDQLVLAKGWWILELLPMRQRVQREDGTWKRIIEMNLARPRVLPDQKKHGIKIHRSVKMRKEAEYLKYEPKLRIEHGVEPTWVD